MRCSPVKMRYHFGVVFFAGDESRFVVSPRPFTSIRRYSECLDPARSSIPVRSSSAVNHDISSKSQARHLRHFYAAASMIPVPVVKNSAHSVKPRSSCPLTYHDPSSLEQVYDIRSNEFSTTESPLHSASSRVSLASQADDMSEDGKFLSAASPPPEHRETKNSPSTSPVQEYNSEPSTRPRRNAIVSEHLQPSGLDILLEVFDSTALQSRREETFYENIYLFRAYYDRAEALIKRCLSLNDQMHSRLQTVIPSIVSDATLAREYAKSGRVQSSREKLCRPAR